MPAQRAKIITFSGIDGAGKSTQICALEAFLRSAGVRTTLVTFWDDVVVGAHLREFMSHRAFRGEQGVGTPERPVNRRDKNMTSWGMTAMRLFLYFADSLKLRLVVGRLKKSASDVVIFDRYIYDELANLPLHYRSAAGFVRWLLRSRIIPRPDVAFLIDADPAAARARKPEYPLEFLERNRQSYLKVNELTAQMTVIAPLSIEAAQEKIRKILFEQLPRPASELSTLSACR
jgi:thymidylate kinase